MIVASVCTIPERKESFQQVARSILLGQTLPVDELHVWLNGYSQIDSDLPQNARLTYHLEPTNPGPWVRYKIAEQMDSNGVLLTLDDDLIYPADYVEMGMFWIKKFDAKVSICFTGILWDPFQSHFSYGVRRFQYMPENSLTEIHQVALHKGQASFFPLPVVRQAINFSLPGFRTNDDMMIGYALQKKQTPIYCCSKPAGWLREGNTSRAPHALYRTDSSVRQKTFAQMVHRLGFDPTAGMLKEIEQRKNRILILGNICPPLSGSEALHETALQYCNEDSSVHILAGTPALLEDTVQQQVDVPYLVHPVTYPESGGRLDKLYPVRSWRQWRIKQQKQVNWQERYRIVNYMLRPTQIVDIRK